VAPTATADAAPAAPAADAAPAAAAAADAAPAPAPAKVLGWERCTSSRGETYFFKRSTGESSWVDPLLPIAAAVAAGAAAPALLTSPRKAPLELVWLPMTDSKGRRYYYNRKTGVSAWSVPAEA
jgi:hypothetical protein